MLRQRAKCFVVGAFADRYFEAKNGMRYRVAVILRRWLGAEFGSL